MSHKINFFIALLLFTTMAIPAFAQSTNDDSISTDDDSFSFFDDNA